MACSSVENRIVWLPFFHHFDIDAKPHTDYVATHNPSTKETRRFRYEGFNDPRGLNLHGMDVVTSSQNPNEVWVWLVNHRPPLDPLKVIEVGADSVIELFKGKVRDDVLRHVKTFTSDVIHTPNDVQGSADGKSFSFTNDHGDKMSLVSLASLR
jgi:arylesterase/paraoxonase